MENLQLQADFAAAVENPHEFDMSFAKQREESGFANFGYDPLKAKALRDAEIARIDAELDLENDDDEIEDVEFVDDDFDDDFDDEDPFEDEDDDYDRYADSYSFDDDEDEEDSCDLDDNEFEDDDDE